MINSFLELPVYLVFLITVFIGSGFSFFALILIRRHFDWESFKENHEVGGFLFNALGLIYAALIAFVVFATWEEYNTSLENSEMEANMLQGLYMLSKGLPEEYQPIIKSEILSYIDDVIENDWPLLDEEKDNQSSRLKLFQIWKIYEGMDKEMDDKQYILYNESLLRLNDLTDYRRLRILSSQSPIPGIMWAVLLIGAMTSIGFSLFFGAKNFLLQAMMTSLFVITNILIILLIANLDNPFSGDVKILPDTFREISKLIESSN